MSVAPTISILTGDCIEQMRTLADGSVHCCVTSPPYWGLRDYGVEGQIGLEPSPDEYIARMVEVFREVRRVLRDDGTLWVNLGDSYANAGGPGWQGTTGQRSDRRFTATRNTVAQREIGRRPPVGIKAKDLVGIPWMLAFALRADGWYLRQDIIWHKPNPMPESVRDRCTKAHEYMFLLSKSPRYQYDAEAIKEPVTGNAHARGSGVNPKAAYKVPDGWDTGKGSHGSYHRNGRGKGRVGYQHKTRPKQNESFSAAVAGLVDDRNRRSVWTITTQPYKEAHFATFPPKLIEPCILAGCPEGGTVLDPFAGSGTTGEVALRHGRNAVLIELNPAYVELIEARIARARADAGLFLSAKGGSTC